MTGTQSSSTTSSTTNKAAPLKNYLFFTQRAKAKQDELVRQVAVEVGWFGLCWVSGDGLVVVDDIVVYEQDVSGGSVDSWDDAAAKVMEEYVDDERLLKLVGHSHANMSAYFSSRDTDMISEWAQDGQVSWIINYVQNKKGEYSARLDAFKPYRVAVPLEVQVLSNKEIRDTIKDEIEKKVKQKKTVVTKTTTSNSSTSKANTTTTGKVWGANDKRDWSTPHAIKYGGRQWNTQENGEKFGPGTYVQLMDGIAFDVRNGLVCREQDVATRRTVLYGEKDECESIIKEHQARLDELAKETIKPGRSVERSEKKRAEGNSEGEGSTDGPRPTRAASGPQSELPRKPHVTLARSTSGSSAQGSDKEELSVNDVMNQDLDPDEVLDEQEAARRFVMIDGDVVEDMKRISDSDDVEQDEYLAMWAAMVCGYISPEVMEAA